MSRPHNDQGHRACPKERLGGSFEVTERFDGRADPARRFPGSRLGGVWRLRRPTAWTRPPPEVRHRLSALPSEKTGAFRHLEHATDRLRRHWPELSAGEPTWAWQKGALVVLCLMFGAAAIASPQHTVFALAAVLVLPFLCVVMLRSAALWHAMAASPATPSAPAASLPAPLPRYSLLIPLYDEAAVAPDLVKALDAIDYPRDRLQVLLILEAVDTPTRAAVAALALPPHMSVVTVPEGAPRTKPRALNYALGRATGDLVVVYDAEDVPEPDQLRRAARLLSADPNLACVQARLNVLNAEETWLTRQYAIEYTALFDCLLPTLQRLGLPVPLGGTSNHFSRTVLEEVGGWDPYNVTEDADLGIRLARRRKHVKVLDSTTWEEAPSSFTNWRNQRTRWLKGWMQTYLVHMRRPLATARDLGWRPFLGLQVLMGGLILSALVHPWFYIVATVELTYAPLRTLHHDTLSRVVTVLGALNLVLGYVTGVALGCVAVAQRGRARLALWALTMPVYWLLVSLAAYRALYQLITTPYKWEKTQHRPRAAFVPRAPD